MVDKLTLLHRIEQYETPNYPHSKDVAFLENLLKNLIMQMLIHGRNHGEKILETKNKLEDKKRILSDSAYKKQRLIEMRQQLIAILQKEIEIANSSTS